MAIAYDNAASTSSSANVASLTTASWTIAGSDRILMAGVMSGAGTPVSPNAVKWGGSGGTDLTQKGSTLTFETYGRLSQWYLVAPTAESNTLYCSWASNQDETALGGASYTGVDQTTPHGTQATATNDAASQTPTVNVTSAAGELVVDVAAVLDILGSRTTFVADAGQTERVKIANVGGIAYESFGMSEEAGAASVTMSWTGSGTATEAGSAIIGIPLKPVAVGGTAVPVFYNHLRTQGIA